MSPRRTHVHPRPDRHQASVLVGVLWCIALLSVVVVSVLHTTRMDLRLARHQADVVQARYLALAGIERAKASLFDDVRQRRRASRPMDNALADAPNLFREVQLGRGHFNLLNPSPSGGPPTFGISDESGRLDLNTASTNELLRLPGMTLDVAAAIVDWRDTDNTPVAGGAEAPSYASRTPPTLPRNAPFQTLRELLMVRGVTTARFQGNAAQPGWNHLLGISAHAPDRTASGEERINLKTADERTLAGVRGFNPAIARAIIARRGQNEFNSLLDLLNLSPAPPQGGPGRPGLPPGLDAAPPGGNGRLISEDLLLEVADLLTVGEPDSAPGRININSAPAEVLACLDGIDLPLAQSLVLHRQSLGGFSHPVALLRAPGMSVEKLRPILPRLTADTDTWRVLSEGVVPGRPTRFRIEAVVRLGSSSISTLSYREDDL